jgi:small-conductance mechanosensitive channel
MDQTFWDSHGDEISAAITIAAAVLLAIVVDRFLIGRAERATMHLETSQFSRGARTRLRVTRRLVFLVIILIGIVAALSQFTEIRRFANLLLGSTAVIAAIVGFAGRTVIANFVAGVLMAVTQPIRIGDRISISDQVDGRVTDVALTYTTIDTGDGAVTVVPNEKIVTEVVVNRSVGGRKAPALAELWLPRDADLEAARKALEGTEVTSVRVAEISNEGIRLELRGSMDGARDREAREAELREHGQVALRSAGLLKAE